jgi:penicillin amidase
MMRIITALLITACCTFLIYVLDTRIFLQVPLGRLLSPHIGFWQNAEPFEMPKEEELILNGLRNEVNLYYDDRMVPHIFTKNEEDAWFMQGYIHARHRLWQMEFQVLAAAGRVSEIVGEAGLEHDRRFRRLGMVFAAENALQMIEANDTTRKQCNAYTAGVNAYIKSLQTSQLPIEYKLLGYEPELWSNLKSALFLKYMSYDLAGYEKDFELTRARDQFSKADFDLLFPEAADTADPVVAGDSSYVLSRPIPVPPADADSVYFKLGSPSVSTAAKPSPDWGSNNWALHGNKTRSGYPILCNDPHLKLNLPSLWFEMQISSPEFNAYGVTFPGAPGIIMGFNDSCAYGFTNGGRDVRDYYEIPFRDESRTTYYFDSAWYASRYRVEEIRIRNKPSLFDTVIYTHIGPVMYDRNYGMERSRSNDNYAVRWKAHDPSNEMMFFNRMVRIRNHSDYRASLPHLQAPGQNVIFASRSGDIAITTQGKFPAKWKGQGDFIMPGWDSAYQWPYDIPFESNPAQFNPERGFVSSANQIPSDSAYPYYLGRDYPSIRGFQVNKKLSDMRNAGIFEMMSLQTDNYNLFADKSLKVLLPALDSGKWNAAEADELAKLKSWNCRNDAGSREALFFELLWNHLYEAVFDDDFAGKPGPIATPAHYVLLEALGRDSVFRFVDDVSTTQKEDLKSIAAMAFRKTISEMNAVKEKNRLKDWSSYLDVQINHLLRIPDFSKKVMGMGGNKYCINAMKSQEGPGWRMIIHLNPENEAYGIYAGGQEGNPGSRYYDNFIRPWSENKYFKLWMMKEDEKNDKKVIRKSRFSPAA